MNYKFTCPFCFKEINHKEALFKTAYDNQIIDLNNLNSKLLFDEEGFA